MRSLNQLIGTPNTENIDGNGKTISQLSEIHYAPNKPSDTVDWTRYSSCRGSLPAESYSRLIDVIIDTDEYTEDERDDAVYDGIWDLLCHQYTFYSVTPLFLDLLLSRFSGKKIPDIELQRFTELCKNQGTGAIYLSATEIEQNQQGLLPIYRIEDILSYHQLAAS